MTKRELLIILILAVLVTLITARFWTVCTYPFCIPEDPATCRASCFYIPGGVLLALIWSLAEKFVSASLLDRIILFDYQLSFLFGTILWFLVLAGGWWVLKFVLKKAKKQWKV